MPQSADVEPAERSATATSAAASAASSAGLCPMTATVAVIGQSPADDAALAAADVAVALRSAGSTSADWGIELATDDVRDAAYALHSARDCLRLARMELALAALPALVLAGPAALGMLPAVWVPVLATAGALLGLGRSAL